MLPNVYELSGLLAGLSCIALPVGLEGFSEYDGCEGAGDRKRPSASLGACGSDCPLFGEGWLPPNGFSPRLNMSNGMFGVSGVFQT